MLIYKLIQYVFTFPKITWNPHSPSLIPSSKQKSWLTYLYIKVVQADFFPAQVRSARKVHVY